MKHWVRAVIVVVLLGCTAGLWWMFTSGYTPTDVQVNKSNVAGGAAGISALALAVAVLWPKRRAGQDTPSESASPTQDPVEYLARETLRYWQLIGCVRQGDYTSDDGTITYRNVGLHGGWREGKRVAALYEGRSLTGPRVFPADDRHAWILEILGLIIGWALTIGMPMLRCLDPRRRLMTESVID